MDKSLKNILIGTGFGVTLFFLLMNLSKVGLFLIAIVRLLQPIFIGAIMAFVLNVPMQHLQRLLQKLYKKYRKKDTDAKAVSFALTLILLLAVIVITCMTIIPQVASSLMSIGKLIQEHIPIWISQLKQFPEATALLEYLEETMMSEDLYSAIGSNVSSMLGSIVSGIGSFADVLINLLMAFVIMSYLLLDKDNVKRQFRKLFEAYLPPNVSEYLLHAGKLLCEIYASFLSGQFLEAVILGGLMWLAFTLFGLPYAGLVAVLTGLLSFIPYVGSFVSCAVGAFIIFMISPVKALISIIVFQVVQFIENQFIYPRVVGGAVGLSALWTLIAVLIGGKLFGIIGMIFFIPLAATAYTLLGQAANKRLGNINK